MKKLISMLLTLGLLMLLGCDKADILTDNENASTESENTSTAVHITNAVTETQLQSQNDEAAWIDFTPPADCEIYKGLAKNPTYYFAEQNGGIVCVPLDNIAKKTKLSLPDNHDGMPISDAQICGVTKDWLIVNLWETVGEKERENLTVVTYRIAIGTWKAEIVSTNISCKPWYNPAGDSLLIIKVEETDDSKYRTVITGVPIKTGERTSVVLEGEQIDGWWMNTLDGRAVIDGEYSDGPSDYPPGGSMWVFDAQNQPKSVEPESLSFAVHIGKWNQRPSPENKSKLKLVEDKVLAYATCGEYFYYVQMDMTSENHVSNLYRMNADNTEKKLLRKGTNIYRLLSVGGRLFATAYNPTVVQDLGVEGFNCEIGIYLLDKEGRVEKTLHRFWDDSLTGNSADIMVPYGNKLMVLHWCIYGPEKFMFLYDPATDAFFQPSE